MVVEVFLALGFCLLRCCIRLNLLLFRLLVNLFLLCCRVFRCLLCCILRGFFSPSSGFFTSSTVFSAGGVSLSFFAASPSFAGSVFLSPSFAGSGFLSSPLGCSVILSPSVDVWLCDAVCGWGVIGAGPSCARYLLTWVELFILLTRRPITIDLITVGLTTLRLKWLWLHPIRL